MQARLEEAQLHARLAWEIVELLSARLRRIPERHRPHYSPSQRFRALEIKSLLGWSRDLAARVFLVCSNTISNWERPADPTRGPSALPSDPFLPSVASPTPYAPRSISWPASASAVRTQSPSPSPPPAGGSLHAPSAGSRPERLDPPRPAPPGREPCTLACPGGSFRFGSSLPKAAAGGPGREPRLRPQEETSGKAKANRASGWTSQGARGRVARASYGGRIAPEHDRRGQAPLRAGRMLLHRETVTSAATPDRTRQILV
jgi:hypothetical protein